MPAAYWQLNEAAGDPLDVVRGTSAALGGPGHTPTEQPTWVNDPLPLN